MALTDYVIMPSEDYQSACDAVRAKTGKSDLIKSGDIASEISSIQGEFPTVFTASATKIYLPVFTGDYYVDWGDGTIDDLTEHNYASSGVHVIRVCNATGIQPRTSGTINVLSVVVGTSVETVGSATFYNNSTLENVVFLNDSVSVEASAFSECTKLNSIIYPTASTFRSACYYWHVPIDSLKTIVINGGNSIPDYTFSDCGSSVTNIKLPDSITSIGSNAFLECESLTSIEIPENVTTVGSWAFSSCSIENVYCADLAKWCCIQFGNEYANPMCGGGYGANLYVGDEIVSTLTIPTSVNVIGDYAFCYCKSLTSVVIPSSVTNIGSSAFSSCMSLNNVDIHNGLTSISNSAFSHCENLTTITIPDSVTSIGDYVFYNCSNLTNITIPEGVTSIGDYAFNNCSSLASITIPEGVTSIGSSAFSNCKALTGITIPNSVTSIGEQAFQGCSSLSSAIYQGTAEEWANVTVETGNTQLTDILTFAG